MYAPTGKGEKWVMNSEGIVLEYSSEPFYKSDEIIAGINAHFGTSFDQEDDIDKDFTVGQTMPSWSAYEKITLQTVKIKFQDGIFGEIRGKKLYIATSNGINVIIVNMLTGLVATLNGTELTEQMKTNYTAAMRYYGYEVSETTSETLSLVVGDPIEDWDEYVLIH